MELKYYLRGLGLGIVVTALIMGFSHSGKQTMTDEEIITRAKQLGMIEDTVLSQKDEPEEDVVEEVITQEQPDTDENDIARVEEIQNQADEVGQPKEDALEEQGNPAEEDTAKEQEIVDVEEPENKELTETEDTEPEDTKTEVPEPVTSGNSVTITISSGDGSYTVSKKLADAGAVSSAETFDSFLCQKGYDKKIRTGTYTIPADASDEQMARIITGAEP
ncbi:MAG: hypothetical protein PUD93_03430 [Lachnospiraceae bacterium]|nr:hypothetical protein [Lachnospiraceae bacterium]